MLLAPLTPRLPSCRLLQQISASLLRCFATLESSTDTARRRNAATAARADINMARNGAAAVLALIKADPNRMPAVLAAPMSDDAGMVPPWPEVCRSIRQMPCMQRPSHLGVRVAVDALDAAFAGTTATPETAAEKATAAAMEAAAEAAAAALLEVCSCAPNIMPHAIDSRLYVVRLLEDEDIDRTNVYAWRLLSGGSCRRMEQASTPRQAHAACTCTQWAGTGGISERLDRNRAFCKQKGTAAADMPTDAVHASSRSDEWDAESYQGEYKARLCQWGSFRLTQCDDDT